MADRIQLFGIGFDTRELDRGVARSKRGLGDVGKSAKITKGQLVAMGAAATAAAVGLNKLVQQGGRFIQLQNAFQRQTGNATAGLQKLRAASRGLVTDYELLRFANQGLILGAVENTDQMAELTTGAIRLGRALGIDAAFAIESLTTGIARQSIRWLDNLGIMVKVEDVNRKLGKGFTKTQQSAAFATAVFEEMRKKLGTLGPEIETVADGFIRMEVALKNATTAFGAFLAKTPLFDSFVKALEGATVQFGQDPASRSARANIELQNLLDIQESGIIRKGPGGIHQRRLSPQESLQNQIRIGELQLLLAQLNPRGTGAPGGGGGGIGAAGRAALAGFGGATRGLAGTTTAGIGVQPNRFAGMSPTEQLMERMFGSDSTLNIGLEGINAVMSDFDKQVKEFTRSADEAARRSVLLGQTIVSVVGGVITSLVSGGGVGGFLGGLLGGAGAIVAGFNPIIGAALGVGGSLLAGISSGSNDATHVIIDDIADRALEKQQPRDPVVNLFFKGDQISSGSLADAAANLREYTRRTGTPVLNG